MGTIVETKPFLSRSSLPNESKGFWSSVTSKLAAFAISIGLSASPVISQASPPLSQYTIMAESAQKNVNESIVFSSSFPKRNAHFTNQSSTLEDRVYDTDHAIRSIGASYELNCSSFALAAQIGVRAIKYSVGNCLEMSAAAFVHLLPHSHDTKIDLYRIEGGDHGFLVIGRPFDSDPLDPKTWGNAIICDTWAKKSFPASRIHELKDYQGVSDKGDPILTAIDYSKQRLSIWASNSYTSQDLAFLVGPHPSLWVDKKLEELKPLLHSFHEEKNLVKRQEIAQALLKLLETMPIKIPQSFQTPSGTSFLKAKADLRDQLEFFLQSTSS